MPTGTATIDFGSTPSETASVVVNDAGVVSGSFIEAFFMSTSTVDNGTDEHEEAAALCPLVCGAIIPGVGFTITAAPIAGLGIGTFTVNWVYA